MRLGLASAATLVAMSASVLAGDSDTRFTLVAKVLEPIATVLSSRSERPERALELTGHLEGSGTPEGSAAFDLRYQRPDKILLRAPIDGVDLTVCRNGEILWVSPKEAALALLDRLQEKRSLPKPNPDYRLPTMALPLSEKELALIPALFDVADAGNEVVDGIECRILDLKPSPITGKAFQERAWTARLWVTAEAKPMRLQVGKTGGWKITVRIDSLVTEKALPPGTLTPPSEARSISPGLFDQIVRAFLNAE